MKISESNKNKEMRHVRIREILESENKEMRHERIRETLESENKEMRLFILVFIGIIYMLLREDSRTPSLTTELAIYQPNSQARENNTINHYFNITDVICFGIMGGILLAQLIWRMSNCNHSLANENQNLHHQVKDLTTNNHSLANENKNLRHKVKDPAKLNEMLPADNNKYAQPHDVQKEQINSLSRTEPTEKLQQINNQHGNNNTLSSSINITINNTTPLISRETIITK